jgi:D-beta-D-heptose 7-phosphate kinase/D-beta-D-heptose 1-phosphate adenosyltransferase
MAARKRGSKTSGTGLGTGAGLAAWLPRWRGLRALVVGDLMVDRYVRGDIHRISPEAPVPVLARADETFVLGGAANVAHNLTRLGARVQCVGILGRDDAGARAKEGLAGLGVQASGIVIDPSRPTTLKTRIVAQRQQLLRIDREDTQPLRGRLEARVMAQASRLASRADVVVLSDYAKGVLTDRVLRAVIDAAARAKAPILVGPKGTDFAKYRGVTAIVANQSEAQAATGVDTREAGGLRRAAERIAVTTGCRAVVITRGGKGAFLFEPPSRTATVPAEPAEVFDVTGAGDTFLSTLALARAAGADMEASARLANLAAGIVVGKVGAGTVTPEDLAHALALRAPGAGKILDLPALLIRVEEARRAGQRVVFTNGCFDLLHAGHIHLLRQARRLGDLLIVALNGDASVRRLKGGGRPLLPATERAQVIAALDFVDAVTIFDEPTPGRLIARIRPDVLAKGDTVAPEDIVGHESVERHGGKVEVIPLLEGSTTVSEILARAIRDRKGGEKGSGGRRS